MRTPITYYGGKQRLASTILSMMPKHKIYCEPFFGGGAVYFQKPKAGIEVINDKNDMLINFYLCIQNRFEELQKQIQSTLHSETLYYQAKDIWNGRIEATDIEKAWAVWFITNGSFAGSMHGGWKWCNGSSGSHSAIMIRNKREEFMAMYGILDIKMRMLRIPELKMIMGFPKDYVLIGTQAEQKKYIGNAVEVTQAKVNCEALGYELIKLRKQVT